MKKTIKILIVMIVIMQWSFSMAQEKKNDTKKEVIIYTPDKVTQTINRIMESPNTNMDTAELINKFCKIYESNQIFYDKENTKYFYDPQQSLFLMVLCQKEEKEKYLQKNVMKDYGVNCKGTQDNGNTCKGGLYENVHNIYNNITMELIDAMTAQAYGYPGAQTKEEKKSIKDLSYDLLEKYGSHRGGSQSLCSQEQEQECMIPETREIIEAQLKAARKLTQKRKWIKEKMPKMEKSMGCKFSSKEQATYDIISCGLDNGSSLKEKHNFISNEMIRYTIFIKYYGHHLEKDPSTSSRDQQSSNIGQYKKTGETRAKIMYENHMKAKKATSKSIQYIGQVEATLPVHIHLLAYSETIKNTRDKLARIYTPLHQLQYKLIDVQTSS